MMLTLYRFVVKIIGRKRVFTLVSDALNNQRIRRRIITMANNAVDLPKMDEFEEERMFRKFYVYLTSIITDIIMGVV